MATITVTLPQMGESVVEGTVERWLVREGERVEKDQILCEVTTDKVDAEIPAPEAGVVTQILVAEGTTIDVGSDLAQIDPAGTATVESSAAPQAAAPAPREAPVSPAVDSAGRASPVARRMAEDAGVPLDRMQGSGSAGRVLKSDVRTHLQSREAPAAAAVPAAAPGTLLEKLAGLRVPQYRPREDDQVIPFSTIRKRIAEHMVVSKVISPHVGTVAEIDMQRVVRLREQHKAAFREEHGFSLTYLPFLTQATVRALRAFRRMNATVVDQSIIERRGIHIGVAVETERGLVVPVVRDADQLSLVGLAHAIEELARRARDRELGADDLQGGTFTLSNPGRQGNLYGFAVINQPQVGILRMGELVKRPVVVEFEGADTIAIRPMMYLALSYDHRIIDGVTGNGFLYRVGEELEAGEFEL
jgi:2-oxoglutarate dehydrogenase E2 component (dihydrolipoamide succinyltransferase)